MPKSKLADMISHKENNEFIERAIINIRFEMSRKGLSQASLAKKMGRAETTVSKKLRNPRGISLGEIAEFSRALNVPPETLLSKRLTYADQ